MKTTEKNDILNQMAQDNEAHEIAEYIWQFDSGKEWPCATVFEAKHGNETDNLAVIKAIIEILKTQNLKCGKLILGVANPEAFLKGQRFVDVDLNRCFGQTFPTLEHIAKQDSSEYKRVKVLKPVLEKTDFFIDLHATIKPSSPFMVVPNLNHDFAKHLPAFGLNYMLTLMQLIMTPLP